MRIKANIYISLKASISDPQGLTIAQGLKQLGFKSIDSVRAGKYLELIIESPTIAQAENDINQMCEELLSNPIIEDFRFDLNSMG
ncbi:MAG: phosphoribosylformylglycinamidine synthase subunit PurS [Dehalococcoidia bacterium]